jgi:hypothetical protein
MVRERAEGWRDGGRGAIVGKDVPVLRAQRQLLRRGEEREVHVLEESHSHTGNHDVDHPSRY